jgi:hypothetical protein
MFWQMVNLFCINYKTLITAGVLMASMLIVLIGCLKPLLFNKISNKHLRGFLLSLTNVVGAFVFVAVAFWVKEINFTYYWFTAICFCIFTVFLYWAYENLTQARAGIHKLGVFMWRKLAPIIKNKLDVIIEGLNDTKNLTNMVDNFVQSSERKPIVKKNTTKVNKDVDKL